MLSAKATKASLYLLLLICVVQGIWIAAHYNFSPTLSSVVQKYPVGEQGMLYVVVSDVGGATVPFTYRYYLHARMDSGQDELQTLRRDAKAFLVTRDGDAGVRVEGNRIKISVRDRIYSFNNPTALRLGERYIPVSVWLDAQPEDVQLGRVGDE
ncbi:MAG: hypothetical protein JWQ69_5491 [Pseudomonas sp.]|nr:hypothetical protein [Pseudomonas sp.]